MSEIPKTSRRFSKRLLIWNLVPAWLIVGYAAYQGEAATILPPVFSFITALVGIYAGVGHMDYRKSVDASRQQQVGGMTG